MQELRFVAVSEDGSYAVLAVPGRSGRYILPIDERLRAVALGQTSRLAQYEIEVESPLRPKEIQARIRAGETAEEIADAAGIPVERVRWFEGPVLAERAYIADQAQSGSVRRAGESTGPGPRLGDIVTGRLTAAGTDPADGQWDSRKRGDGNWQVSLTFPSGGRLHVAEWVFDPRRRHVMPDDDNAARLSLPESELPAEPVPVPGEATVTPIAPRLGAAAGMGGGGAAPGVPRFRPERSVIPDRSLGVDRSLVERPATVPDRAATGPQDRTAAPSPPAPARPAGQQERPSQADRPASPGYAEFPESAPYRAQEPAPSPEPPAHREQHGFNDPAPAPEAFRAPAAAPPAQRDYGDPAREPSAYREPGPGPRSYRDPADFGAPAPEPPAYGHRMNDPAAYRAPAGEVPAFDQPERGRVTPPRPVVFEDPEPTFLDDQPELASEPVPPASPARAETPLESHAADAPAQVSRPAQAAAPADMTAAHSSSQDARRPPAPVPAQPVTPTVPVRPSAELPSPEAPDPETPAAELRANPDPAPTVTPAPAGEPEPSAAAQPEADESGPAAAQATPEATAAAPEPTATEPKAETPSPPATGEGQPARRPGKKNAKARRSSVPSWDEIMLGSSRQRD